MGFREQEEIQMVEAFRRNTKEMRARLLKLAVQSAEIFDKELSEAIAINELDSALDTILPQSLPKSQRSR
jgi:hypothetical protein